MPTGRELKALRQKVKATIVADEIRRFGKSPRFCAIGGSTRAVLKLAGDILGVPVGTCVLSRDDLKRMRDVLFAGGRPAIDAIIRCCPNRLHTVVPGFAILLQLIKGFGAETLEMSPCGIREGFLKRILSGRKERGKEEPKARSK